MSFSFTVAAPIPSFSSLLTGLREPVRLTGATWTADPWPKGVFAKIADATNTPQTVEMTPELEAMLSRAGLGGSFLISVPGSTRGVDVARTPTQISFRVLALASRDDYALAAQLAAAAARVAGTTVQAEHGADGGTVGPLSPDALLAQFDDAFFERNARAMGTGLVDDAAGGRTYFLQGPCGFVRLGPDSLAGVPAGERFERARVLLLGDARPRANANANASTNGGASTPGAARRDAVLLTAAMSYAAGADGKLDDAEARQLDAHFGTVKELAAFDAGTLVAAARAEVKGIDDLRGLSSTGLRRKAFVLAAEVLASARDGKLTGETSDRNVQALMSLATALGLGADTTFLQDVVVTCAAKYITSSSDDTYARTLTVAMMLSAASDGAVDDREAAVLQALARTVPELRVRDFAAVLAAAKARIAEGLDLALADLRSLPKFKNKCFALAAEVALVSGRGPAGTCLPRLFECIGPNEDFAKNAIATFTAKY